MTVTAKEIICNLKLLKELWTSGMLLKEVTKSAVTEVKEKKEDFKTLKCSTWKFSRKVIRKLSGKGVARYDEGGVNIV